MKTITGLKVLAVLSALFAIPFAIQVTNQTATAATTPQQAPAKVQQQQPAPAPVSYHYVAQPGDSYTLMARKALQTYGKKYQVNLTEAGIVFGETKLTKQAGSPQLVPGQAVEIQESTVKSWADESLKLTDKQQKAWNYYVQFVNFNTDHVGQAS